MTKFSWRLSALCLWAAWAGACGLRADEPEDLADRNLLDYGVTPFSDHASHVVLLRKGPGLAAWQLRSAWALGAPSAQPQADKDLFAFEIQAAVRPLGQASAQPLTLTSRP